MAAEQVIIEFIADASQLAPGIDKLEQLGKVDQKAAQSFKQTNAEIAKRNTLLVKEFGAITDAATGMSMFGEQTKKTNKTLQDLDKSVKGVTDSFVHGFQEGVADALHDAGVSAEEFADALKTGQTEATKGTESLRTRLKNLKQDLAQLELAGETNTQQFREMAAEAGRLDDAISDTSQRIKTMGSDTRVFEGLVGAAAGVAGAFSAVQAAVSLFGDESEEVQEVLLRVNQAMAIAQGLAQVHAMFQKQSAAALLFSNVQRKIQNAQLVIENGLTSKNVIVKGAAIVAQRALNAAMAANPIGLVVVAITALILAYKTFTSGTESATASLRKLNAELDRDVELLDDYSDEVKRNGAEIIAGLEARGAKEGEIRKQRVENLRDELKATLDTEGQYREGYNTSLKLLEDMANKRRPLNEEEREEAEKTVAAYRALTKRRIELASQVRIEVLNNVKAEREETKAEQEKALQDAIKAAEKQREARARILADELAGLERKKLTTEKDSQEEIDIEKKIIAKKAEIELNQEQLTANQIKLIKEKSLDDQLQLQKNFNAKSAAEANKAFIARNTAELQNFNLSTEEKLRLTIENIHTAAQIEVDAAEGNQSEIKRINAERDAAVKAARLKSIEETVDYEIALEEAKNAELKRSLERAAVDPKKGLQERLDAITELTNHDLKSGEKRINALNSEFAGNLISIKEYNLKYEQLIDAQKKIVENGEKGKQDAVKKTTEDQKAATQAAIDVALAAAKATIDIISTLSEATAAKALASIERQKREVSELRTQGAITEKEELARMRKLDAEERQIKNKQARQEKQLAIFSAIIATAEAVTKALAVGGPYAAIYAGIVGAMGAAQVAAIAARPIPQFKKGKKDSYEGLGEVAESGPEILETGGRKYLMQKPAVVWLSKKDKVYNPKETMAMMNKQIPGVNKAIMNMTLNGSKQNGFDYQRLGREISKNIPSIGLNVNEEGFKQWVKEGLSTTKYLNNRRSF